MLVKGAPAVANTGTFISRILLYTCVRCGGYIKPFPWRPFCQASSGRGRCWCRWRHDHSRCHLSRLSHQSGANPRLQNKICWNAFRFAGMLRGWCQALVCVRVCVCVCVCVRACVRACVFVPGLNKPMTLKLRHCNAFTIENILGV